MRAPPRRTPAAPCGHPVPSTGDQDWTPPARVGAGHHTIGLPGSGPGFGVTAPGTPRRSSIRPRPGALMPTIDSATLTQMEWRTSAACRDSDPELFFPIGDAGPARRQEHRALDVCAGCPVREVVPALGTRPRPRGRLGWDDHSRAPPDASVPDAPRPTSLTPGRRPRRPPRAAPRCRGSGPRCRGSGQRAVGTDRVVGPSAPPTAKEPVRVRHARDDRHPGRRRRPVLRRGPDRPLPDLPAAPRRGAGRAPEPAGHVRVVALRRRPGGADGLGDVLLGPRRIRRPGDQRAAGGHHAVQRPARALDAARRAGPALAAGPDAGDRRPDGLGGGAGRDGAGRPRFVRRRDRAGR